MSSSPGIMKTLTGSRRPGFQEAERSSPRTSHELVFAIKQLNLDILERETINRATPGNPLYQKWLTQDEIGKLVTNKPGYETVAAWLASFPEVTVSKVTPRLEYITATAPITIWEVMLATEFFKWNDQDNRDVNGNPVAFHRCKQYFIPHALGDSLDHVFNTVQVPPRSKAPFPAPVAEVILTASPPRETVFSATALVNNINTNTNGTSTPLSLSDSNSDNTNKRNNGSDIKNSGISNGNEGSNNSSNSNTDNSSTVGKALVSQTAELPSLNHITSLHRSKVYEPSDDTFLLCDALADELQLRSLDSSKGSSGICPALCVEIGSGSGCVITYLAKQLTDSRGRDGHNLLMPPSKCQFIATDINPDACELTLQTSKCNNVCVDVVRTRFTRGIDGLLGNVDVLIFNPPYVPTDDLSDEEAGKREMNGCGLSVSWAGGVDGREVIDEFLPLIQTLLSEVGVCFMVVVKENKPKDIAAILKSRFNLQSAICRRKRSFNEDLMIMKIYR